MYRDNDFRTGSGRCWYRRCHYTRVRVACSQQADLVTAWTVVREAFAEHDVPSTLMGVTVLGHDHQIVKSEAVAGVVD